MSLTQKDIDQIMQLLEQSSFSELRLETGELKLHLRRAGAGPSLAPAPIPQATAAAPPPPPMPFSSIPPLGPGETDVVSPLLGVFYRAPKPGEPPFVEVGQLVQEDTIIGIVEVMKLMNSVRAGVSGEVVVVHAANAEMVEFDQPLVRIRKAD